MATFNTHSCKTCIKNIHIVCIDDEPAGNKNQSNYCYYHRKQSSIHIFVSRGGPFEANHNRKSKSKSKEKNGVIRIHRVQYLTCARRE